MREARETSPIKEKALEPNLEIKFFFLPLVKAPKSLSASVNKIDAC